MTLLRLLSLCILTGAACEGGRTTRGTAGATGTGPDFNGGFDRRPFSSYGLPDGGIAYEWPISMPDGWTMEAGVWTVGVFDLYGEGFNGGAPLMCGGETAFFPCPGTGAVPNNSALSEGVCWSYNGGCTGANAIRSAAFSVSNGAAYTLSAMVRGKLDPSDFSGGPPRAGLVFQIDWLAGAAPAGTVRIPDDLPLTTDWAEHRFDLSAPSGATAASIRIELARTKRDIRLDNLALLPQ